MTNENYLKCIKMDHKTIENGQVKDVFTSYIDNETYKISFVKERWQNERRTQKQYTLFGYNHTKTTVKFDDNTKSVRVFTFPKSLKQAQELHLQNQ